MSTVGQCRSVDDWTSHGEPVSVQFIGGHHMGNLAVKLSNHQPNKPGK